VPLSIDLSISRCRVIFAIFFFFGPFADSVLVGAGVAAGGGSVVAAGRAGAAAGGVGGAAVIVSAPVFDVFWASKAPAGKDTSVTVATAVAMRENFFMGNSNVARCHERKFYLWSVRRCKPDLIC
jgi:hypothetical protein